EDQVKKSSDDVAKSHTSEQFCPRSRRGFGRHHITSIAMVTTHRFLECVICITPATGFSLYADANRPCWRDGPEAISATRARGGASARSPNGCPHAAAPKNTPRSGCSGSS